jgi:molybdopterin molybdotransferase
VGIVVTGDELLPAGSPPDDGRFRIPDASSPMLEALVRRDGGLPGAAPIVPDDREEMRRAVREAAGGSDALLLTGASSVGAGDHLPAIVAEEGELAVHGVAMRPASPTGVGFLGGAPVFLLPGNPVSTLCAYEFFAGPAVRRLGGRSMEWPHRTARLPVRRKIISAVGRVDYARVRVAGGGVEPLAVGGAGILSSTTRADGVVVVPGDLEGHAAGEIVTVHLYDP